MISKVILLLLILAAIGAVYYFKFADKKEINSFEDCVKAGGVILESYPEQCSVPGAGRTFPNPKQIVN